MEYYSAVQKNKLLMHTIITSNYNKLKKKKDKLLILAIISMNLKITMLN